MDDIKIEKYSIIYNPREKTHRVATQTEICYPEGWYENTEGIDY